MKIYALEECQFCYFWSVNWVENFILIIWNNSKINQHFMTRLSSCISTTNLNMIISSCIHCIHSFETQLGLKRHENAHKGVFKYICDLCGKGFNYKTNFDNRQSVHSGLKPHSCDKCGRCFMRKADLNNHVLNCGSKGYKPHLCVVCKKRFSSTRNLQL